MAQKVSNNDKEQLIKIAKTSMQTKLVSKDSEALSELVVNAILQVSDQSESGFRVDIDDVKVEKKAGGSLRDTRMIRGIVLDKEVVHGGMPKRIEKGKIALINSALEIEKTEFDAKDQYKFARSNENVLGRREQDAKRYGRQNNRDWG